MLAPLDIRTLADQAFEQLEGAIVRGELPPGTKITEARLANAFGISRGPLREALKRLEGCQLVERMPHVGVRIIALSAADMVEVFYAREALEGMACRLAAQSAADEEIARLRDVLETHQAMDELRQNEGYFQRAGTFDFHYAIVGICGNRRLIQACNQLYYPLRMYRYRSSKRSGRAREAYKEHLEILDAIERREPEEAERRMRRHVANSRAHLEAQALDQPDDLEPIEENEPVAGKLPTERLGS